MTETKRTYQVLSPVDFGGDIGLVRPVDEAGTPVVKTVELDDDQALPLELVGAIELVEPQPEQPKKERPPGGVVRKPSEGGEA